LAVLGAERVDVEVRQVLVASAQLAPGVEGLGPCEGRAEEDNSR
jgi:hypothetical protein